MKVMFLKGVAMNIFTKKSNKKQIEELIDSLTMSISLEDPTSENYKLMTENLKILEEAKSKEDGVSKDATIGVMSNVGLALLILNYEKIGVITSKAFQLIKVKF